MKKLTRMLCTALSSVACVATVVPLQAAITNPVAANYTLTEDESVDAALTVNSGVTVDLAGHKLTVKGLGTADGTITSSVAGGVLEIDVDSGVTVNNTAVTLTGGTNLQVWKTGAGTLKMSKKNAGFGAADTTSIVVKSGLLTRTRSYETPWGANQSLIKVEDGGAADIQGWGKSGNTYTSSHNYRYDIAGNGPDGNGALVNNESTETGWNLPNWVGYLRALNLSADASIGGPYAWGMCFYRNNNSYVGLTITMNGHTLTFRNFTDGRKFMCWTGTYSGNGTIVVAENTGFQMSMGDSSAPDCNFIVRGTVDQNGNKVSPVKSLVFEPSGIYTGRAANQEDKQTIVVYEKYAPNLNYTGSYPTMRVTLGASGHTETTLDLGYFTNRTFNASATTFYAGSTVTVDTGARELQVGEQLVSWPSSSSPGATFSLATATPDVEVVKLSDGLYVKSTLAPAYAVWNLEKEGDDKWDYYLADGTPFPHEWTEGVTSSMQVHFCSLAEYVVLTNANLGITPMAYVLTGLSLAEGTDEIDLSGLGFILGDGATIDLKGNTVTIPCSAISTFNESTITDSSSPGGRLVIDVPSGQTVENTSVTLSGSLRFVKRGAGTFVPTKLNQPYTGGNEIAAGTVKLSTAHNQYDGYFNELGGGHQYANTTVQYADVEILPGATVDQNGQTGLRSYMFVLKGGTLTNTGADIGTSSASLFYFRLAEAERSYVTVQHNMGFYRDSDGATTLDLGGKTLQMGISAGKHFYLNNTTISNGTLDITSGGYLHTFRNASNARNANIDLNCALWLEKDLSVSNIVIKYNGDWDQGTAALNVYGTFRPETAGGYFYGPTMQDGSTLDFSAWPTSLGWPVYSRSAKVTNGVKVRNTFTFANGATVKIKLGAKKVPKGTKIVDWRDSTPSNLDTLKFVCGDEGRGYSVVKRADGLYYYSGFAIIVK